MMILTLTLFSCNKSDIDKIKKQMSQLNEIKKAAIEVSPIFDNDYPVVVLSNGYLNLFEKSDGEYHFIKSVKAKNKYHKDLRAACPTPEFDYEVMCLVSESAFDSLEEMVLIFHEFVHVYQMNNFAERIKQNLKVYQNAQKNENWMWELNHPFPYDDKIFIESFTEYLDILNAGNLKAALLKKEEIKKELSQMDYEYLVWQEFIEGYARYLENNIKRKMNISINKYGAKAPFSRISFYRSGDLLIRLLIDEDKSLSEKPEELFDQIKH